MYVFPKTFLNTLVTSEWFLKFLWYSSGSCMCPTHNPTTHRKILQLILSLEHHPRRVDASRPFNFEIWISPATPRRVDASRVTFQIQIIATKHTHKQNMDWNHWQSFKQISFLIMYVKNQGRAHLHLSPESVYRKQCLIKVKKMFPKSNSKNKVGQTKKKTFHKKKRFRKQVWAHKKSIQKNVPKPILS